MQLLTLPVVVIFFVVLGNFGGPSFRTLSAGPGQGQGLSALTSDDPAWAARVKFRVNCKLY